ncbi:MAG: delta-60 repeat domain-containing protein, partial [Pirellulales bacterium]
TVTSLQLASAVAIDATGTNFIIAWLRFGGPNFSFDSYFKRFSDLNFTPLGFGLNAIAAQPTPLLTIPAYPTARVPLGLFADPSPGNWTFTLVSGAGSTDIGSFQINNGLLSMTPAGVTSGVKAHYSIRVRATPDLGVPVEQVFDFSGGLSGDINFAQLVPTSDYVHAAVMQANGQFIVAGTYGSGYARTALARYNPDGSLDPSFGGKGEVVTNALSGFNYAEGVAIQPNGQIVAIGTGYDLTAQTNPTFLVRYNPDGSLDTSFGNGGILEEGTDVNASVIAVQDDGKIVIAGNDSSKKVAVWRFNADGTLDSTFGSSGKATLALGTQTEFNVTALAIQR